MRATITPARLRGPLIAFGCAALGALAHGQGFNVDFGLNTTFPVPTSAYGAASAQSGTWNAATFGTTSQVLLDLGGAASGVTVTESGALGSFQFDNAGTFGDDHNLLDDYLDIGGPGNVSTVTFAGLADGSYDVYTYAWAADNRTGFCSFVDVAGSPDGQQMVCGAWAGSHAQGVTYARHGVNVSGGTITIMVEATPTGTFGTLNGVQVVPSGPQASITPYCFGDGTGVACPGGGVGAAGHGCPNSKASGVGALLVGSGNPQVSNDTFSLFVDEAAQGKPGLLIMGGSTLMFNGVPDSAGILCLTSQLRGNVVFTDGSGEVNLTTFQGMPFGATALPAGQTTYYQFWFRDPGFPAANPGPNAEFNFSNGVAVDWVD